MLEIDETELKLLLEKRKKFINGSNFAEFGEIISGISLAITLLVTDCSKITFMPSLYFELIVWAITASILGHGIYRLIVSKKHSYSIKNLYDEVVDLDPKTEHSFNIVVFRNIHEKGKYLLFYSKRWQCWLFPNYRCQDGKFDENAEIKQIKACDCDFCEWQDVQRKAERFKRGYSCGIPVPEEHIKQVEMIDRDMDYYLMRMEDGWCCGVEGEHIVEGKNQQDIIKSMSNIKVCHCSKCRHWLSRWVDLSWKIGKAD